jgi:hypothetical protein
MFILQTVDRTPWTGDQPIARSLQEMQTEKERIYTAIPGMGFELTIPVFEWAKTLRKSERTATIIGSCLPLLSHFSS